LERRIWAAEQLAAADRASSGEAANPKANVAGPAAELEAVRPPCV
jgi:hypothetical protein